MPINLGLLFVLIKRDFFERYAGSVLGFFWVILIPLCQILVFWLIFSKFLRIKVQTETLNIPFLTYLLSGMLPWLMMQEAIIRSSTTLIEKANLIKKVYLPTIYFSLVPVFTSFIVYGIGFIIFFCIIFFYMNLSLIKIYFTIFLLLLQFMFTVGICLFVSSLSVFLRDISHAIVFIMQLLLYTTTVLYPINIIPENYRYLVWLNPFTPIIEGFHLLLIYQKIPEISHILSILCLSLVAFILGFLFFNKVKRAFVDVL